MTHLFLVTTYGLQYYVYGGVSDYVITMDDLCHADIIRAIEEKRKSMKQSYMSHREYAMNDLIRARKRYYYTGMAGYFFSGICSISVGVIVSLLQDHYRLSYGFMGTLVSALSVGNMLAILTAGVLPGKIGERSTTLLLSSGFFLGYVLITAMSHPAILLAAFVLLGIARGLCTNKCTVLVGNHTDNRTKGIALLNSCWSVGALLCPIVIAGFALIGTALHTSFLMQSAGLAVVGLALWLLFLHARLPKGTFEEEEGAGGEPTDGNRQAVEQAGTGGEPANTRRPAVEQARSGRFSFLKQPLFWLLTLLIFCDMGVENSVNGWLVSYYKSEKILSGVLSTYTVTIEWAAILAGRLMTAFVYRSKKIFRTICIMSSAVLCTLLLMVMIRKPVPAIIALVIYSFAIGGIFPTAVSGIGELMNSQSVGIMLSLASISSILFPWLIGIAADGFGLRAGMMVILVPAAGILLISFYMHRKTAGKAGAASNRQ